MGELIGEKLPLPGRPRRTIAMRLGRDCRPGGRNSDSAATTTSSGAAVAAAPGAADMLQSARGMLSGLAYDRGRKVCRESVCIL